MKFQCFEWHDDYRIVIFGWTTSMFVFMCLHVISSDSASPNCKRQRSKGWRLSDVGTVTGLYKNRTGVGECRLDFELGGGSALSVCVWRGDWPRAPATRLRQTAVYLSEGPALSLQHFLAECRISHAGRQHRQDSAEWAPAACVCSLTCSSRL